MPVNEMLAKILSDYLAANPQDSYDAGVLHLFCEYATKWLSQKGPIGVGHTADGLAIRFSDGQEYLLTSSAPAEIISDMPAMSITGNNGGSVRGGGAIQDSAIRITG